MKSTTPIYESGADMWRDYAAQYGSAEAMEICNRYLDLQIRNTDPEELAFCRELFAAMEEARTVRPEQKSVLAMLEQSRKTPPVHIRGNKPKRTPTLDL